MRLMMFFLCGALLGASLAALLGRQFGSGVATMAELEFGIYMIGGGLLGGFLGVGAHVVTRPADETGAVAPGQPKTDNVGGLNRDMQVVLGVVIIILGIGAFFVGPAMGMRGVRIPLVILAGGVACLVRGVTSK